MTAAHPPRDARCAVAGPRLLSGVLLAACHWEKAPSPTHNAYLTVAGLGLIGGALLVGCITAYVLGGRTRNQAYLAYLFLGAVAPLLVATASQ